VEKRKNGRKGKKERVKPVKLNLQSMKFEEIFKRIEDKLNELIKAVND
jgi:hypothetical protein